MSWNYRIIKTKWKLKNLKGNGYAIHEVYYDEKGRPTSWSAEPQYLCAETKEQLMGDIVLIRQAFRKPTLEIVNNKLKEI